jgi:1-phosphofructokinase family hexose kinase
MILILLPHPALDKTVVIPGFSLGQTYRATILTQAGGKGFNVARALRTLGHKSRVVAPLGGHTGALLQDLASHEGLECDGWATELELRICLTIVDPEHDFRLTEIYEQSQPLTTNDWRELTALTAHSFKTASFLAICGSIPGSIPEESLYHFLQAAQQAKIPVLLDSYGPQVVRALETQPALLKINQHEAGMLLTRSVETISEAVEAARELQQHGPYEVVITLGKDGAVGITRQSEIFGWSAPQVQAVSTIGSGDCVLAGIAAALERGEALPAATRLGIAAGAANTLQIGAGRFELSQIEELLPQVQALKL